MSRSPSFSPPSAPSGGFRSAVIALLVACSPTRVESPVTRAPEPPTAASPAPAPPDLEAPVEDAGVVDERCLVPYTLAPVDPAPAAPLPTRAEALALLRGAGVADLPTDGEIDVAFHQRVADDDRGWKMEVGGYYVGEDRSVVVARADPEPGRKPLEVSDLHARTEQERAELALVRRVATCAGERPVPTRWEEGEGAGAERGLWVSLGWDGGCWHAATGRVQVTLSSTVDLVFRVD